jgi:actin-like ATPase involved in cell morphogenesis
VAGGYGLGIDLGTTYTAAALWRGGRAETVPLGLRAHTVPSVLFLREDDVLLVGEAAARRGAAEPDRVAREFKRTFGDGIPFFLGDRELTAEELAGQLLRWVVGEVTTREGGPPAHVTLTHPANWGEHRTGLLVAAAEQAGLADVGLLVEPVAAAAYHASTERLDAGAALAVYDLGGGTFDVTIVRKTATGFAVEGTPGGDDALGGVDFDQAVMDHVTGALGPAWRNLDLEDPAVLAGVARLRESAVEAKEALSLDVDATVPVILPGITREVRITRGEFETAVRIPLLRTVDLLAQAIENARLTPADVRSVLLVGGSSRIPLVSRLIAAELGIPVALDAHPKYAVCLGAAIATGARLAPDGPATAPARPGPDITPGRPAGAPAGPPPRIPAPPPGRTAPTRPPGPGGSPPPPGRGTQPPGPLPAPAATGGFSPAPAAAAGVDEPPAPIVVDLPATGITEAVDTAVDTTPTTPSWTPRLVTEDEPLTVTHTGDRRRGRRAALVAAAAAALVLAAVAALVLRGGGAGTGDPGAAGATAAGSTSAAPPVASAGSVRLTPQPVTGTPGDRIRAVTATASGAVAVGGSDSDGTPRAWRRDAAGAWVPAKVDQGPLVGAMNGVAAAPGRTGPLVAVGWVAPKPAAGEPAAVGDARRPAVWTSKDGASWTLGGDDVGRAGLGELTDVIAGRDGGFVAAGTDWSTDPRSGDGAVLTSPDGRAWTVAAATGLGGRGQTVVRRLLVDGAGYLAVGTRPDGGLGQPAVWTSPDAVTWTPGAVLPHGGAGGGDATGVARLPAGGLLVVGTTSTVGGRAAAVWSGPDAGQLRPYTVDPADAAACLLEGVAVPGGRVTAVGAKDGAAAWTLELGA